MGVGAAMLGVMALFGVAIGADRGGGKSSVHVLKQGDIVFIRCPFSEEEDLLVKVGKGTNRQINFFGASLLNASAGMTEKDLAGGKLIHGNGDDSTPWNINGTYIGANHGCSDARELTSPNHGKKTADLGSAWEDETGAKFYLIKIPDENRLWVLSANSGKGNIWKFKNTIPGSSLKGKGGATLPFEKAAMVQLTPACRIKKQEYLLNGKTRLDDGRPAACDYLDIIEDYDIINPASLVEDFAKHPGSERDFTGDKLEGVINNHIVYRFYPNGANVIYTTSKALQEFQIGYMGFIQSAKLTKGSYETQEYYIPKTVPFTQDGANYDFQAIQDYDAPPKSALKFTAADKNIADAENLPDRFIQFLGRKEGDKTVREVGYALGYSLIHGITRPKERAKNTDSALMLYTSSKSYPSAVNTKMGPIIPAGTLFECVAYRQYFCPAEQKAATCFYWHEENGDTVVYADYHRKVERDSLKLPIKLAGKTVTVVEKTPSLTLRGGKKVTGGGITVSVDGNYGYVVLKVK